MHPFSLIFRQAFEINGNEDEHVFWQKTFWDLSKERTKDLHEFMNAKPFLDPEVRKKYSFKVGDADKELKEETFCYYGVSNIGDNKLVANGLKIEEFYTAVSFTAYDIFFQFLNTICSIDGKLFWLISYHADLFRQEVIEFIARTIGEFLEKIATIIISKF